VPDPIYLCEMALEMGKSIRELTSGEPGMSAHELCVVWPEFFAYRERQREREAEKRAGR